MKAKFVNQLLISLLIIFLWGCFGNQGERQQLKPEPTLKKVVKTSMDEAAFYLIDAIREYETALSNIDDLISKGFKLFLETERLYSVEIVAVGDIIPHGMVKNSGKKSDGTIDFDPLFKEILDDIKYADISFGNLETPYNPDKELWKSIPFSFNIPLEMIETIQKTGFDILTLANNHMYDQGVDGIKHTVKTLDKLKIEHIGAGITHSDAKKGVIFNKKGIKIGFLGYTTVINNDLNNYSDTKTPYLNRYDSKSAKEDVLKLKKSSDILIVSIHWGSEYHNYPSQSQKDIAQELFSWGVDIILGHHPHVLQPIVPQYSKSLTINPKIVAYSLGNFLSNQFFDVKSKQSRHKESNREGIVLKISLVKENGVVKIYSYNYVSTLGCKTDEKNYKIYICRDDKKSNQTQFKKIIDFIGPESVYPESVVKYVLPIFEKYKKFKAKRAEKQPKKQKKTKKSNKK